MRAPGSRGIRCGSTYISCVALRSSGALPEGERSSAEKISSRPSCGQRRFEPQLARLAQVELAEEGQRLVVPARPDGAERQVGGAAEAAAGAVGRRRRRRASGARCGGRGVTSGSTCRIRPTSAASRISCSSVTVCVVPVAGSGGSLSIGSSRRRPRRRRSRPGRRLRHRRARRSGGALERDHDGVDLSRAVREALAEHRFEEAASVHELEVKGSCARGRLQRSRATHEANVE